MVQTIRTKKILRGIIGEMKWAPIKDYRISPEYDIVQHIQIIEKILKKLENKWYIVTNGMKIKTLLRSLPYEWSEVLRRLYESNESLHYDKIIASLKIKYEESRFIMRAARRTAVLSMSPNLHSERHTNFEKLKRGLLTH